VASRHRNKNFIWDIKGENNMLVNDQALLKKEATSYYNFFYKTSCSQDIVKQCKLADLFPQMVDVEESRALYSPVTI
jgi:hypothetical protein